MVESGCVKPYPTSQGGPEVKYLLQGGMSGKGSLLAKPSRPLGTSLKWRSVLSLHDHRSHFLCEKCGMCSRPGVWQGAGSHLSLGCLPTESLRLDLLYLTKLPGMVLYPTSLHALSSTYFNLYANTPPFHNAPCAM